jgi:mono/diheme cytochrome c family protein
MPRSASLLAVALVFHGLAGCYGAGAGAVRPPAGEFEGQASVGRADYAANCSRCHGAALQGGAAPALIGSGFMSAWGPKSTLDLYQYIASAMPAGNPGSMSPSSYAAVTEFILHSNGANFGTQPYASSSDFNIATLTQRPRP